MDTTYYIVMGTTGEYSDRCEWTVRVFKDETEATDFIGSLEEVYRSFKSISSWREEDACLEAMTSLDPNFECDYTGTSWYYIEVDGDLS